MLLIKNSTCVFFRGWSIVLQRIMGHKMSFLPFFEIPMILPLVVAQKYTKVIILISVHFPVFCNVGLWYMVIVMEKCGGDL